MRIIGITGGICSGKSGVTRYLLRNGYPVIDCDKITDSFYEFQWFTDGLRHLFGKKILYNKEVNRGKLGALVFKDPKEMKRLNSFCFPHLLCEIKRQLEDYISNGYEYVFIDAPILFESGLDKEILFTDYWILDVDRVEQIRRLKQRKPYLTHKAIHNILSSQLSNSDRLRYATYIIENNVKNRKMLYEKIDSGLIRLKLK